MLPNYDKGSSRAFTLWPGLAQATLAVRLRASWGDLSSLSSHKLAKEYKKSIDDSCHPPCLTPFPLTLFLSPSKLFALLHGNKLDRPVHIGLAASDLETPGFCFLGLVDARAGLKDVGRQ